MYFGQQFNVQTHWDRQDVFEITGRYPFITGFDYINRFSPSFGEFLPENQDRAIRERWGQGGFITVAWHAHNPVTGGNYNDRNGDPVANVLPGGSHRTEYLQTLDGFADWAKSINIPILFRPYHEVDVPNFWWSRNSTQAQYRALWQDMVTYLRDTKGVHNLIYVWSVGSFHTPPTGWNPGSDYYDILGIDCYNNDPSGCLQAYQEVSDFALAAGKKYAITEGVAQQDITTNNTLWTTLVNTATGDAKANRAVYLSIWTSRDFGPHKGRSDEQDFIQAMRNQRLRMLDAKKYRARMRNVTLKGMRINAQ